MDIRETYILGMNFNLWFWDWDEGPWDI